MLFGSDFWSPRLRLSAAAFFAAALSKNPLFIVGGERKLSGHRLFGVYQEPWLLAFPFLNMQFFVAAAHFTQS